MTLFQGDTIDRYVIDGPLGAGGMGEVYRARDTRLKRAVALKILRPVGETRSGQSEGAARMIREAILAAALDHPNVIAIFDVGEVATEGPLKGTTYIAMELIKGRSLRAVIADPSLPSLEMRRRVRWLMDIARALAAAHDVNVVHRDIKPDNVMIGDNGVVKVLDFGIARKQHGAIVDASTGALGQANTMTAEGVIIGTPLYMSPEQMRDEDLDGRADQFSWGVLAYELLTGVTPWGRNNAGPGVVMSQILSAPPPSLEPYAVIPEHVKEVVLRALAKDRDARFPSMHAVVAELEAYGDSQASTPGRVSIGDAAVISSAATIASGASGVLVASRPSGAPPSSAKPASDAFAATERMPPSASPIPSSPASADTGAATASTGRASVVASPIVQRPRAIAAAIAIGVATIAGAIAWRVHVQRSWKTTGMASTSASISAAIAGCASNQACTATHGGKPWTCRASDHQCVAIESEDCSATYEPADLNADDTVWIGAMFPLKGPQASAFGQMNANGVELARKEIADATRSLRGEGAAQRVRPIAIAMCDDSADPMRAAKHLVDDVGVPAIVGFKSGQEVIDVAGGLLIKRDVLAIASLTSNPLITKLPLGTNQTRLVVRTTYSYDGIADAAAAFVSDTLEPRLRLTPLVLAVVRADTSAHLAFGERLFRRVVFNGKSALDNGHDYIEASIKNHASKEDTDRVADLLIGQHVGVVVFLLDDDSVAAITARVEAAWPASVPRPTYVDVDSPTAPFWPLATRDRTLFRRVFSIVSASETTRNARFVMRFNALGGAPVTRTFNPGVSYDAAYAAAYATFAAGPGAITGVKLSNALSRLRPPGVEIEAGPNAVLEALSELAAGRNVDLQGVQSDLDFVLRSGESPVDFDIECAAAESGAAIGRDVDSGVHFRARAERLEGTLRCP